MSAAFYAPSVATRLWTERATMSVLTLDRVWKTEIPAGGQRWFDRGYVCI